MNKVCKFQRTENTPSKKKIFLSFLNILVCIYSVIELEAKSFFILKNLEERKKRAKLILVFSFAANFVQF